MVLLKDHSKAVMMEQKKVWHLDQKRVPMLVVLLDHQRARTMEHQMVCELVC